MSYMPPLMTDTQSHRIPFPHFIDHTEKLVYIRVKSWMSAMGASQLVKKWYPGLRCVLVNEDSLERVQKEGKEKE